MIRSGSIAREGRPVLEIVQSTYVTRPARMVQAILPSGFGTARKSGGNERFS
jgi:hypothetical protein